MMRNLMRVAKRKTHELRPRKKSFKHFGSRSVGVGKTVDTYDV